MSPASCLVIQFYRLHDLHFALKNALNVYANLVHCLEVHLTGSAADGLAVHDPHFIPRENGVGLLSPLPKLKFARYFPIHYPMVWKVDSCLTHGGNFSAPLSLISTPKHKTH
jgi:hypothetical protein